MRQRGGRGAGERGREEEREYIQAAESKHRCDPSVTRQSQFWIILFVRMEGDSIRV